MFFFKKKLLPSIWIYWFFSPCFLCYKFVFLCDIMDLRAQSSFIWPSEPLNDQVYTDQKAVGSSGNSYGIMSSLLYSSSSDKEKSTASNTYCRYKTELCRTYEDFGKCKYRNKCQFAHGMDELRSPIRHPKYKTEPCRKFHLTGFCNYGPRCNFMHNEYNEQSTASGSGDSSPFAFDYSLSPPGTPPSPYFAKSVSLVRRASASPPLLLSPGSRAPSPPQPAPETGNKLVVSPYFSFQGLRNQVVN